MEKTFNPCDECEYSFHKQNQDSGMCKICEFEDYRKLEKSGRLRCLPCKVGATVYVLTECRKIDMVLDGTLCDGNCGMGTATGYYCPYEDSCPHIEYSDDCDKCADKLAVFEDTVTGFIIDRDINGILIMTEKTINGILNDGIYLTREAAEAALKESEV